MPGLQRLNCQEPDQASRVTAEARRLMWIRRFWRATWPGALLAVLCLGFYLDALTVPAHRLVGGNDLSNMFLHWLQFAVSTIRQGRFPLWNPYLFSGLPFVANPQPALFYPPTWLALAMPVTRALGIIIVFHIWLAGLGMMLWLRSEGVSRTGALFAGLVFTFSGYFFVRVRSGHLGVISTGAWLPLILWAYRTAKARRSWKLAVVAGLPVGLSILGGHTASFIYVALGLAAYVAYDAWRGWQRSRSLRTALLSLGWMGVMVAVGLAVAAVQLLPMAELARHSTRQDAPYEFAATQSWPPGYLLTLLVPNFFGEPVRTGYWGDGVYDEMIFYVGVLPLILGMLGLRSRHRLARFLAAVALLSLLLALGQYGALHPLMYRLVPLFRVMRAPARAGFLFAWAAIALAGIVIGELDTGTSERRARLLSPMTRSVVLRVAGGALALIVAGFLAFAWGREDVPAAGRLWHLANRTAVFLLLFLLTAALLAAWRGDERHHARMGLFAVGLALIDLWGLGYEVVQVVDVVESPYWRVVSEAAADPQSGRVLPWALDGFQQNGGMPFEMRSVFGYDPLILRRYEDFVSSWPDPRGRTYDLLNVEYLVMTTPEEFSEGPDAPQLLLEQEGVRVYRRPQAMPRAWVVPKVEVVSDSEALSRIHDHDFDPRAAALVETSVACAAEPGAVSSVADVRDEGNRIEARVRGGGGLLIFSEIHYPGWQATIDGNPAALMRADYLLRAVCIPSGEHQVVLTYEPLSLKLGLAGTGLALVLVVSAGLWSILHYIGVRTRK